MSNNEKYCQVCDELVKEEKVPACPLQCRSGKCKAYEVDDSLNLRNKPVIWVLGGPGCGKGTQCKMIAAKYGFTHFSTGGLIESEINSMTPRARCLITVKTRGALVPNDLVLTLLKDAIKNRPVDSNGIIIDGFPKEKDQGIDFEQDIAPVSLIIFLDATEETMITRLGGRKSSQTHDQTKMRMQVFKDYTDPILSLYLNKLVRINANRSTDEIFSDIVRAIDPIIKAANATGGANLQSVTRPTK